MKNRKRFGNSPSSQDDTFTYFYASSCYFHFPCFDAYDTFLCYQLLFLFYFERWYKCHASTVDNSGAPAAEGRQAEPHTHIRKLKGTHELIFSCVSWLAVLLVGAYARRRRRRRRRWWSRATWRPQLTRKPKRGFSFRGLSL